VTEEIWSQRRSSFGTAADEYSNGRPHYPLEALQWATSDSAHTVLDLGAGTGILSRDLLDLGLEVTAVEPLAEMRALIPSEARAVEGTAESIPLPDGSFDGVYVGQAWHWFEAPRALVEARRVLRPGGRLVLMWNLLNTDDALSRTVADIIEAEERSDMMLDADENPPFDDPERFGPPEVRLVSHAQDYDPDRVVQFALSRSQSILLAPEARRAMVDRLRSAVPDGPFSLSWFCEAWRATAR
jgi:SAM-dependent methyltransferase